MASLIFTYAAMNAGQSTFLFPAFLSAFFHFLPLLLITYMEETGTYTKVCVPVMFPLLFN